MMTIKEIERMLTNQSTGPRKGQCAACGARLPRRRTTAGRCETCGVTYLSDADVYLLHLLEGFDDPAAGVVEMLRRIEEHHTEVLAWFDGQLRFVRDLLALHLPQLNLEKLVSRGFLPEGKILEMYRAAHARARLDRDQVTTTMMH